MTKIYTLVAFTMFIVTAGAQNIFPASGSAGIGTVTPKASSALDITSSTKGILIPRMTTANRDSIVSPAKGLMIFQTDGVGGFYYYTGSAWKAVTNPASQWVTSGNNIYYTKGNVGIGTSAPKQKLHIAGGLRIDTLANGTDSGLLRHNAAGTVYSLKFTGDSTQALRGNGTFGSLANGYWSLNGNAGTSGASFIGTTDFQPLRFKINSTLVGLIDPTGFNTLFGGNAPITNGTGNTSFGANALSSDQGGYQNTAIGYGSLTANVSGWGNVGIGLSALYSNVYGSELVAIGDNALYSQNGGNGRNVAIGGNAMYSNTTGYDNVATGFGALSSNIGGRDNTAIGSAALESNLYANENTAIGHNALLTNSTGYSNTSVGAASGYFNTTGSANSFFGVDAGEQNTSGSYNSFFGYSSGALNISGINNSFFGQGSGFKNTTGQDNTFIGNGAGYKNVSASSNTFIGGNSGFNTTTGATNTGLGFNSMVNNSTGHSNVAIGINSLNKNSTGSNLVAVGDSALFSQNSGTGENTAVGSKALYANTGGYNNTAVGYTALKLTTTGNGNTATGTNALSSNTDGSLNTADGSDALIYNTSDYNSAFGNQSLRLNTTGYQNTGIGLGALYNNTTGASNTAVGYFANVNFGSYSNSTAIGYSSTISASNQVRIGNNTITSIGGFKAWTNLSDGRFKKNIKENVPGLAFIKKLRPITYTIDVKGLNNYLRPAATNTQDQNAATSLKAPDAAQDDAMAAQEKVINTGFIAQEVEKTANDLGYDFDGVDVPKNKNDVYGLRYSEFVVPLVKAVQELAAKNDDKDKQITDLQTQLGDVKKQLQELELKVSRVLAGQPATQSNISLSSARLEQNTPNPFNQNTLISYYIPQGTGNAALKVVDMSGKVIKVVSITAKGNGQLSLDTQLLAAGTYMYTLFVDGKQVDTKKMVLAK